MGSSVSMCPITMFLLLAPFWLPFGLACTSSSLTIFPKR